MHPHTFISAAAPTARAVAPAAARSRVAAPSAESAFGAGAFAAGVGAAGVGDRQAPCRAEQVRRMAMLPWAATAIPTTSNPRAIERGRTESEGRQQRAPEHRGHWPRLSSSITRSITKSPITSSPMAP
jgi:hypothetical protein